MADNPLKTLYDSVWNTLESKTDFLALFPNGSPHQVRYDTDLTYEPDPELEELAIADYPRCRVTVQSLPSADEGDSATTYLDVGIAIEVCTGAQRQSVAFDASWAIFRAMTTWRTWIRDNVTWNGAKCVADWSPKDNVITDQSEERNRGTKQWIVAWQTTAKLYFQTTDLETL